MILVLAWLFGAIAALGMILVPARGVKWQNGKPQAVMIAFGMLGLVSLVVIRDMNMVGGLFLFVSGIAFIKSLFFDAKKKR